MGEVTIVANEVSEETRGKLEQEVKKYSLEKARKFLARKGFRVRQEGSVLRCTLYK